MGGVITWQLPAPAPHPLPQQTEQSPDEIALHARPALRRDPTERGRVVAAVRARAVHRQGLAAARAERHLCWLPAAPRGAITPFHGRLIATWWYVTSDGPERSGDMAVPPLGAASRVQLPCCGWGKIAQAHELRRFQPLLAARRQQRRRQALPRPSAAANSRQPLPPEGSVNAGCQVALVHKVGSLVRGVGVSENGGDWETLPWLEHRYRS